jgi:hypothetical protein
LSSLQSTPLPPGLAVGREKVKTCYDLLSADPSTWKDVTDRVGRVEEVRRTDKTIAGRKKNE